MKLVATDLHGSNLGLGLNRRRPRHIGKYPDLADKRRCFQGCQMNETILAFRQHIDNTVEQNQSKIARLSLLDQKLPLLEFERLTAFDQVDSRPFRQTPKHCKRSNGVHDSRGIKRYRHGIAQHGWRRRDWGNGLARCTVLALE